MAAAAYVPRHRADRHRDEASNSFVLFIVLLPVILGAFGLGLDVSRNIYIRTSLQNDLDMATVAGAAVTKVSSSGAVAINTTAALSTVEKMYAINRAYGPGVQCWGDRTAIPGTGYQRCWKVVGTPTVNGRYIKYTIKERSTNAFLGVIGVPYQTYTLVSTARVNQDTQ